MVDPRACIDGLVDFALIVKDSFARAKKWVQELQRQGSLFHVCPSLHVGLWSAVHPMCQHVYMNGLSYSYVLSAMFQEIRIWSWH